MHSKSGTKLCSIEYATKSALESHMYGNSSNSMRKCANHIIPVPMAKSRLPAVFLAEKFRWIHLHNFAAHLKLASRRMGVSLSRKLKFPENMMASIKCH